MPITHMVVVSDGTHVADTSPLLDDLLLINKY